MSVPFQRIARILVALVLVPLGVSAAQSAPTIEQFMSPPVVLEVAAAAKADRLAWIAQEGGLRNVYTATGPAYQATRITRFLQDDGIDVGLVRISDDGSIAAFTRGTEQNSAGWVANPLHDSRGGDFAVWAARTDGSAAWRLASLANREGGGGGGSGVPVLSPNGRHVVFVRDGQIYHADVSRDPGRDTAAAPLIKEWGRQSNPVWSPDGSGFAFVTTRDGHSFIGLYDIQTRRVRMVAPGVDLDVSPTWSPDGKRIAFIRRPGTPFGAQLQQRAAGGAGGRGAGGRGGAGGAGGGGARADGLYRAAFGDGSTIAFMVADLATGEAKRFWHNRPGDGVFAAVQSIVWAGNHVVFGASPVNDEWDRYYSVSLTNAAPDPVLLTTTDGLINDGVIARTFVTWNLSRDGSTFYYSTNATDTEKRHIWAVPVAGGQPKRISTGAGVEVSPAPSASGRSVAVLYMDSLQTPSVALVPSNGGAARVVFPTAAMLRDFPRSAHVTPQTIVTPAPDGLQIHSQLMIPRDIKPGERRPAIVFVHGGPARQILPTYHYMRFYTQSYAFNQYLQSRGFIVLSVNFRSGVGYGSSFRRAPNTGANGNAEYQDVVTVAKYLQSRPDVDPTRIGIWGSSYGGILTAQALARNSDIFRAGVDHVGIHLWGASLDTGSVSYQSSSISQIDNWKSPVYLAHGDDDRNVAFTQTIGLVQLLRAKGVYYELTVYPNETHGFLIESNMTETWKHSAEFLERFVRDKQVPPKPEW